RLAALGVVSHRPTPDDGPIERLERAQVAAERVAENVARAASLTDAHARWMGSPSHRANVLDAALDAVGFGVAARAGEIYVVELFATHPTLRAGP
ncbi:MAG: SCP-like extracellular protein, partial [Myxococcaceae bacterium]|nr:SCP-like extracellular protein [Myxococcaceae bacterium]